MGGGGGGGGGGGDSYGSTVILVTCAVAVSDPAEIGKPKLCK